MQMNSVRIKKDKWVRMNEKYQYKKKTTVSKINLVSSWVTPSLAKFYNLQLRQSYESHRLQILCTSSQGNKGSSLKKLSKLGRSLKVIDENLARAKYLKRGWLLAGQGWHLARACITQHSCWPAHTHAHNHASSQKISENSLIDLEWSQKILKDIKGYWKFLMVLRRS